VEILNTGQKFGLPVFKPLGARERLAFRTVSIAAAVETDALMATSIALLDVPAEGGSPAQFDGAHCAQLPTAQRTGMDLPIGGAEAAEDIRHFERWPAQRRTQDSTSGLGGDGIGSNRGSRSKGLAVAQTVVVATFRYRAVVARLR